MKLDKKQIKYIADLARLELSEEEVELYGRQLSDILSYVDQLHEVDTAGIEPTAQVTGLVNVYRDDEIKEWPEEEKSRALEQAPELDNNQIKTKRVL